MTLRRIGPTIRSSMSGLTYRRVGMCSTMRMMRMGPTARIRRMGQTTRRSRTVLITRTTRMVCITLLKIEKEFKYILSF